MGGLPVMRNAIMHAEDPLRECLETAYLDSATVYNPANHIPNDVALPLMLDKVYTLADVVEVDYQIPGCPPSGETLWRSLQALLAGTPGELPYDLIKYD
jgi:NAD-reducing hydrogenase small subunit